MAGKGCKNRLKGESLKKYKENWEKIFSSKEKAVKKDDKSKK